MIKKLINNFLVSGNNFTDHDEQLKHKFIFINSVYGFGLIAIFIMSIVRYLQNDILISIADGIFTIVILFSLLLLRSNHSKLTQVSNILLATTYIVFFAIFLFADTQSTRLSIFFLLIGASYFLQGKNKGLCWLLLTIASVSAVQFTDYIDTKYSNFDVLLVFLYLSIFYFILNTFEMLTNTQTKNLLYVNNNLEKLIEKRTKELEDKNRELLEDKAQLQVLSATDHLTGLHNRNKLERIFNYEQKQALRYHSTLSLILIDIDHFKYINDQYGHNVGDNVLKEIAEELLSNFRDTDAIGRWGGEEFLVLLPKTDLQSASEIAQKVRQSIEKRLFSKVGHQTASFGVATLHDYETLDALVNRADKALYQAKKDGRNNIKTA